MQNRVSSAVNAFLILTLVMSLPCSAADYLSMSFSEIKKRLQSNLEELIVQKRVINFTEQTLDVLANKGDITKTGAQKAKQELDTIFEENFKKASLQQRLSYQIQRPFQFVYQKLTDPNASNLERFAYAAATAVGVGITIFGLYQAGKYAQSAPSEQQKETLPDTTKEIQNILEGNIPYHSPEPVDPQDIAALQNRYNEIKNQEYILVKHIGSYKNPNFNEEDLRVAKKQLDNALQKQQLEKSMQNISGAPLSQENINTLFVIKKKIEKNYKEIDKLKDELRIQHLSWEDTSASPIDILKDSEFVLEYLKKISPEERKRGNLFIPSPWIKDIRVPIPARKPTSFGEPEKTWYQKTGDVLWDMVTGYIPKD
jgi:hypothetical protein